jgi:hypothetical protein
MTGILQTFNPTTQLEQVAGWMAMRTRLNKSERRVQHQLSRRRGFEGRRVRTSGGFASGKSRFATCNSK